MLIAGLGMTDCTPEGITPEVRVVWPFVCVGVAGYAVDFMLCAGQESAPLADSRASVDQPMDTP